MNGTKLFSIREAASASVNFLRKETWGGFSHIKIDIVGKEPGPWVHLYDPMNLSLNGRDPYDVPFLNIDYEERVWVEYSGPTSEEVEYKEAQEAANLTHRDGV